MDFSSHSILWILIIGLVVGAIAKLLMPGRDPGGCIITVLLGIAGALIAGWIGHAVGWDNPGEGAGFVGAIVGAFLLLLIYRLIAGRRGRNPKAVQRPDMGPSSPSPPCNDRGDRTMKSAMLAALMLGAAALPAAAQAQQTS